MTSKKNSDMPAVNGISIMIQVVWVVNFLLKKHCNTECLDRLLNSNQSCDQLTCPKDNINNSKICLSQHRHFILPFITANSTVIQTFSQVTKFKVYNLLPEHIYNPITSMGSSAMFVFQLDNTKR